MAFKGSRHVAHFTALTREIVQNSAGVRSLCIIGTVPGLWSFSGNWGCSSRALNQSHSHLHRSPISNPFRRLWPYPCLDVSHALPGAGGYKKNGAVHTILNTTTKLRHLLTSKKTAERQLSYTQSSVFECARAPELDRCLY